MRFRAKLLITMCLGGLAWAIMMGVAYASSDEACFTSRINGARAAAGRPALATRSDLVAIARRHSQDMANDGRIYHNTNLRNEAPSDWQTIGENVGVGPTCSAIHQAFMNSPGHRANILDIDYNTVGVGVVVTSDGTIYVTEIFMQTRGYKPSSGTSTVPSQPRPRKPRSTSSPPPPAPPPPPPPGSKIIGKTLAYIDVLEREPFPYLPEPTPSPSVSASG